MVHCPTSPLAQVLRLVHKRLSMCAIIAAQKYDKHATQFASMLQLEPNMSMRKSSCKGGTGLHTCSPCLNSLTPQFPGSCTQCNHLVAPHKGWHPSSENQLQQQGQKMQEIILPQKPSSARGGAPNSAHATNPKVNRAFFLNTDRRLAIRRGELVPPDAQAVEALEALGWGEAGRSLVVCAMFWEKCTPFPGGMPEQKADEAAA
eukprot:1160573-Pelagomonas_calceolata.AAC.13